MLLDDVRLTQDELEQVIDIAPHAAFVVATRKTSRRGEVRCLALKGLPIEDAVLLLEREIDRSLDVTERSDAATLCAAIGAHPFRILQAAALIREQGISPDQCAQIITQSPVVNLMASIDDKQRRALLALAAIPGVPLQPRHVSAIAEVTDIEPSLTALVRRGLVVGTQSRYHLADGVGDRLRRTEDLKPWTNRVITYFTAWAERHLRSQDMLLQESEALLRVQQSAADGRRWEKFCTWVGFSRHRWPLVRGGAPGASPSNAVSPPQGQSAIDRPKPGRCINSAVEPYVSATRARRARCCIRP